MMTKMCNNSFSEMSVAVKCKKNFCLKLPNSWRKPIKNFLHFKMFTLQNVKFEMSEYINTTNETEQVG